MKLMLSLFAFNGYIFLYIYIYMITTRHPPQAGQRMAQTVVLQGPNGQQLVVDDVHLIEGNSSNDATLCTVQPGTKEDTVFLSMIAQGAC